VGRTGAERAKIGSIVIRCYGFDEIVAFWQGALHYAPRDPTEDSWVVLRDLKGRGPNESLKRVAEPLGRIGKTSRVHLDLYTTD
jgi:glyoxalase superfamily protein